MKWPVYIHSSSSSIGKNLKPEQKVIFEYLRKELHRYLTAYSLREDLLKDFLKSWNQINSEPFLPVLLQITKLIRYRLLDANAIAYHRLVHLCNALIRNCGTMAHALLGREKFLRTLLYCMKKHLKSNQILSNDSAALCYRFLKEWTDGLNERRDLFPYYQDAWSKASSTLPQLARFDVEHMVLTNVEKLPVEVAEEYRTKTTPDYSYRGNEQFDTHASSSHKELSIQVDDESLNLNRVSSIAETPLTSNAPTTISERSPNPKPAFVPQYEKASSQYKIVIEEKKPEPAMAEEDDSTVNLDHYYEDLQRMSKRMSVGTVNYEAVYEQPKSTDECAGTARYAIDVMTKSPKKEKFEEKFDVTFKYYGTQRVVSYKKSQNNVLSPASSHQAIMQQ